MGARDWQRGVGLVTAIFFGILCLGLATSFLLQVPVDLSATAELRHSTEASYIADAAIQETMAWLSHRLTEEEEPCTTPDPTPLLTGNLDGWQWTCLVEPDSGTPPNGVTALRLYKLTAVALRDGEEQYRIVADVQAGQSFARFSIFIDEEQPAAIWYDFIVTATSRVTGPIHKNDHISFKVSESLLGSAPGGQRPFNSVISTSNDHHWWTFGNNWADRFSPPTSAEYDDILENGEADLLFGVPPRPLPGDSNGLSNAAWGGMTPASPPAGVSVSPAGGVFIFGDVTHMEMAVDGSGNFVLTVNQGGQVTTIVEQSSTGQRLVSEAGGSSYTVPGLGSGVIFATGDILSLRGTNKGAHTIANRFEDGKVIEISGSITRADTTPGSAPAGTDDRLGLVSHTIFVAEDSVLPRDPATPLHIYSHMLATDTFWVKNYNGEDGAGPGAMEIFGGLATRYPWRTVRVTGTNYQVIAGYGAPPEPGASWGYGSAPIHYDKLLDNEPPPMYPTTAGTELMIRAWREQPL